MRLTPGRRGSAFQMAGYTLMAPALPFPALVVAYCINGVGIALQVIVHT